MNEQFPNYTIYGEIDFAIVSPSGKLILIEQKTGYLDETEDGLEKKYSEKSKNVPFQIARNAHCRCKNVLNWHNAPMGLSV